MSNALIVPEGTPADEREAVEKICAPVLVALHTDPRQDATVALAVCASVVACALHRVALDKRLEFAVEVLKGAQLGAETYDEECEARGSTAHA